MLTFNLSLSFIIQILEYIYYGFRNMKEQTLDKKNRVPLRSLEFPTWLNVIFLFAMPFLAFYMLESFVNDPWNIEPRIQLTNYMIFMALQLFFIAVFRTQKRAAILMSGIAYLVGFANFLVLSFRGTPITPWDYKSMGTAISVLDNYSFPWSVRFFVVTGLFLALLIIASFTALEISYYSLRLVSTAATTALLVGVFLLIQYPVYANAINLDNTLFTPTNMYRHNGFSVAFIRNTTYLQVPEPEGYSIDRINDIIGEFIDDLPNEWEENGSVRRFEEGVWLALRSDVNSLDPYTYSRSGFSNLEPEPNTGGGNGRTVDHVGFDTDHYDAERYIRDEESRPNVIVVMSEAFSDLSVLANFSTNIDYMPFLNSLDENVIKGYLHTSIIGGNTATSEFEFLTSDSMAFLPAGSVAYQQFVVGPMPTLNSMMSDLGYRTVAMHPYAASGWERDIVYPYFGFDTIKFDNDFVHTDRLRNYISDESLFNEILLELENTTDDQPAFIFTVSMQNHGGYSQRFEDVPVNVEIQEEGNFTWLDHYLSLIRYTDLALESFINELEALDEETIVLFFGDHQPNNNAISALENLESYTEDPTARYVVPYVIWANYDIGAHTGRTTSLNYMASDLLRAAGIPLSPYMNFLENLQEKIPVITANYYILNDGQIFFFGSDEEPDDPEIRELINQYEVLQYNHLIDTKNRVDDVFSIPPASAEAG